MAEVAINSAAIRCANKSLNTVGQYYLLCEISNGFHGLIFFCFCTSVARYSCELALSSSQSSSSSTCL
jgi:hypothetical protein